MAEALTFSWSWGTLLVALLLPALPLIVSVYVFVTGAELPISTILLLFCIIFSGVCFHRTVRSAALKAHQPALTGRKAGVSPWLPMASLPLVACVLASVIRPVTSTPPPPTSTLLDLDIGAQWVLTVLNITLALMLVWAVSALVLMFTRSSLRAISVWTAPWGSLANTGGVGPAVVRWYYLGTGAVIVVSAYAVGYALASPLGEAFSAYRIGAASARLASEELASYIRDVAVYPVMFLLLPLAATLIAAIISSNNFSLLRK